MKILPNPQKAENVSGSFELDGKAKIFCDGEFVIQAEMLADLVYDSCGFFLQFTDVIADASIIFAKDDALPREGYVIMISRGVTTVTASAKAGCFYAVQSLRQVFNLDAKQQSVRCPDGYVEDSPRFAYRGFMLDISRHFFGVDVIKTVIELMSQVKLNVLHLHLTDDQGFRLQIDKYPLLTEIASKRGGSQVDKDGKTYVDDVPHSGYLTKEDVRELVAYAAIRNVEIVPEIDLPGHFVAAIAAYPELSCTGNVTEVRKKWSVSKDILCAGNDKVYEFVNDVLDEVCELFPSKYVHLGGENVAKDRWCNCKLCRERMAQLRLDGTDALQTYMIEQFRQHLEAKGKTVIIRNDGVTPQTDERIVSQVWTFPFHRAAKETRTGRKIIVSSRRRAHFNHDYNVISLKRLLKLRPFRGVKKEHRDNVLGVEGSLWTQHTQNTDELFYWMLPRLDALAECAWSKNKSEFLLRLQKRFVVYDKLQLNYNKKFVRKAGKKEPDAHQGDNE